MGGKISLITELYLKIFPPPHKLTTFFICSLTSIAYCFIITGQIMTLDCTQPTIEMSTRGIPWGNGGQRAGVTTFPSSFCRMSINCGNLNFMEHFGFG
jgi:hypothetical protein